MTFLVETSDLKSPRPAELGYDQHVLHNEPASNQKFGGHVPRNTRLALAAVDLVEPYVCFSAVQGSSAAASAAAGLTVRWYVGGAHVVDKTWLAWHTSAPRGHDATDSSSLRARASAELRGKAKWGAADPLAMTSADQDEGQFLSAVLPPPAALLGDGSRVLWLVAHAVVDQQWAVSGQGAEQ